MYLTLQGLTVIVSPSVVKEKFAGFGHSLSVLLIHVATTTRVRIPRIFIINNINNSDQMIK
jgi:hypothetical protein